jgi:V8-like Glu-specific endopeptidase
VHPKYNAFCSYDIAIAKFDPKALSKSLSEKQIKSFFKSLKKNIPPLGSLAKKACIEIVGHTMSGIQLISKGKFGSQFSGEWEVMDVGECKIIVYPEVNTFNGQSGGPIYMVDDQRELVGIHVGKYSKLKAGLGLNEPIKDWLYK